MARKMRQVMVPLEVAAEVPASWSAKDALVTLLKLRRGYRLLAVKERGRVVGLVGPKDILRALAGEGQKTVNVRGWSVTLECGWLEGLVGKVALEERIAELAQKPLREIIVRQEEKLQVEDDLSKAVQLLARSNQEALLVWQGNRPVGLVGTREILRALGELAGQREEGSCEKVVYLNKEVTTGTR